MSEHSRLTGKVARINVDNADGVLYIMLGVSPKKHVFRIPQYIDLPMRKNLNLTAPGDNVSIDVDEELFVRHFTNDSLDD